MEKSGRKDVMAVALIFTVPLLNIIYTVINGSSSVVYNLVTDMDNKIPFVKYFILPYNLWYPFIISTLFYLCFTDRRIFYKTVLSIDMGLICCYIIYILFQTTVPRPVLVGDDLLTRLVKLTYRMDEPYNCFPSIHVLTSYIMMKAVHRSRAGSIPAVTAVYAAAGTIIVSTLFVKQHVVMDIFSGIILGNAVFYGSTLINEERIFVWIKKQFLSWMMKRKLET